MDIPALLVISSRSDDTRTRIGGEGIRTSTLPRLSHRHAAALASSITTEAILPPALLNRSSSRPMAFPYSSKN